MEHLNFLTAPSYHDRCNRKCVTLGTNTFLIKQSNTMNMNSGRGAIRHRRYMRCGQTNHFPKYHGLAGFWNHFIWVPSTGVVREKRGKRLSWAVGGRPCTSSTRELPWRDPGEHRGRALRVCRCCVHLFFRSDRRSCFIQEMDKSFE